jgi:gliding motility-associated-like protein
VVKVIDYLEFMTPNQAKCHDIWNIIGISEEDPTSKIYIFEHCEKRLKQLSPHSRGWEGMYSGNHYLRSITGSG